MRKKVEHKNTFDDANTYMHIYAIFSFSRCLCIQLRFIYYIFVFKRCFDFISGNPLNFYNVIIVKFCYHRCHIFSSRKAECL